ncbi:MAG TPA: D-glycero-beta-D-manno-heptose 1,7-bisphosphate 7-phosphatase [Gammaproteobacteria bacterium]|nr:D-glycero-beta-D-manno-heptose 1,7-bisphosphate 7-phosphatase [Gammaproteobacteria bacterium]
MKLVILDRDGVINEDSDHYIKSPEEWVPLPGSLAAIARLNQAGYRVVVASNQSGLARGYFDRATLARMHDKMHRALAQAGGKVEEVFFCPHHPDEGCACRKPRPGMLHQIATRLHTDLNGVPFIGDSLSDVQAARAVGAAPILVRTGKGKRTLARSEGLEGVPVFDDLAAAVAALLRAGRES